MTELLRDKNGKIVPQLFDRKEEQYVPVAIRNVSGVDISTTELILDNNGDPYPHQYLEPNGKWFVYRTETPPQGMSEYPNLLSKVIVERVIEGAGPQGERGEQGPKGEPGEPGPKGESFTFDDLTPEQINEIKGNQIDLLEKSPQLYDFGSDLYSNNARLDINTGNTYELNNMRTTDFLEISPSRILVFAVGTTSPTSTSLNTTCFYDANKVFIIGYGNNTQSMTIPSNAKYVRKTTNGTLENLGMFYDAANSDFTFWRRISTDIDIPLANKALTADIADLANTALVANTATVADSVKNIKKVLSKQKFNIATITPGRIDVNTGAVTASSGYSTSDFIEIEDGTTSIIIAKSYEVGSMNFNNLVYFDSKKARISGFNSGNAANTTPDEYGRLNLVPPANAKYLRYCVQGVAEKLGIFFNYYSNNFNYYTYYEFNKSAWTNKKVVAYGDSLVAGASNSVNTWLGMLAKELNFEPLNRGIGGSTVLISDTSRVAWVADGTTNKSLGDYGEYVSRPSGLDDGSGASTGTLQPAGTVEITSSMCSDARINTIPTNADAIIILAGTNGMDEASYRLMLQKIYTKCPQASVFCCSLTFRYSDVAKTQIVDVTNNNNVIRNLCQEFGSHYIDLKGMEGLNHYNKNLFLSDNVHATSSGNLRRAKVINNVMKNKEF